RSVSCLALSPASSSRRSPPQSTTAALPALPLPRTANRITPERIKTRLRGTRAKPRNPPQDRRRSDDAEFPTRRDKGLNAAIQLLAAVNRADLRANPSRAAGDDGKEEPDRVNAVVEEAGGELLRERGVAKHHRADRVIGTTQGESGAGHCLAEVRGVVFHAVREFGGRAEHFKNL